MFTQDQWNHATKNSKVHALARKAAILLQDAGERASRAEVIDYALRMAREDEHISLAEFYAAWMFVLNPWMLERPEGARTPASRFIPFGKKWRLIGLLGSWHLVARRRAFRFYLRENEEGERYYFADYRVDDLVSRFHCVGEWSEGVEVCAKRANEAALAMSREGLAQL